MLFSLQTLILVGVIALIVVGPKTAGLGQDFGQRLKWIQKATEGITDELKEALQEDKKQDDDGLNDSLLLKKNVEEETKPNSTNNEANK